MIKSEFIDLLEQKSHYTVRKDVEHAVQTIFEQMTDHLASGQRIEIRGFGSFNLNTLKPRLCRNPKTGEKVLTKPKRVIRFRAAKELNERLNKS